MRHILFPIIVTIMISLMIVAHTIVLETFINITGIINPDIIFSLRIVLLSLIIGFVGMTIIGFHYNNYLTRILYTITASWIGVFVYAFIASVLYGLSLAVALLFNAETSLIGFGQLLFLAVGAVSAYGLINARHIRITNVTKPIQNIPDAWKDKTAVWISDVHFGQVYNLKRSYNIVRKINALNPDIIFIGGDLYDGAAVNEQNVIEPFKQLKPQFGTFFVMGNHEEFHDNSKYMHAVKSVGIRVLDNEVVTIHGLQIVGVDYHDTVGGKRFSHVLSHLHINRHEPSILLKHVPLGLDLAEKAGVSLMISGHTHRGQIFPLPLITKIIYKGYDYGLKKFKSMNVLTSSGVGGWGPPLRVGTRSEIVRITF